MRRVVAGAAVGWLALAAALACGDVPTLPSGVAYISPILAPSPSVAFGDTLRDSLGRATPLRVYAFGRDSADTIRSVTVRYILTSLGIGGRVANGFLVAPDSLATLRIVAQVVDGAGTALQVQTPELSVEVTPRADSIARTTTVADSTTTALPLLVPLSVTVTGTGPRTRGTVNGIRVRYRIAQIYPATAPIAGRYYLSDDAGAVLRPDSTRAIDTTAAGGIAVRSLVGLRGPAGETAADSVVVEASALSQHGDALHGSPVRFTIRLRK